MSIRSCCCARLGCSRLCQLSTRSGACESRVGPAAACALCVGGSWPGITRCSCARQLQLQPASGIEHTGAKGAAVGGPDRGLGPHAAVPMLLAVLLVDGLGSLACGAAALLHGTRPARMVSCMQQLGSVPTPCRPVCSAARADVERVCMALPTPQTSVLPQRLLMPLCRLPLNDCCCSRPAVCALPAESKHSACCC